MKGRSWLVPPVPGVRAKLPLGVQATTPGTLLGSARFTVAANKWRSPTSASAFVPDRRDQSV